MAVGSSRRSSSSFWGSTAPVSSKPNVRVYALIFISSIDSLVWSAKGSAVFDASSLALSERTITSPSVFPELPDNRRLGPEAWSDLLTYISDPAILEREDLKSIVEEEKTKQPPERAKDRSGDPGDEAATETLLTPPSPDKTWIGVVEEEVSSPAKAGPLLSKKSASPDVRASEITGEVGRVAREGEKARAISAGIGHEYDEPVNTGEPIAARGMGTSQVYAPVSLLDQLDLNCGEKANPSEKQVPLSPAAEADKWVRRCLKQGEVFSSLSKRRRKALWERATGWKPNCDPMVATGFVFMVNRKSGNRDGERFMQRRTLVDQIQCNSAWIFEPFQEEGYTLIHRLVALNKFMGEERGHVSEYFLPRVIAVGGDGTVGWVIDELFKRQVDMEWVALGTIGFGTGNDFFRAFELPRLLMGLNLRNPFRHKTFQQALFRFKNARLRRHDVLDVTVEVDPEGGSIHQVVGSKSGVNILKPGQFVMKRGMNNYFSTGIMARIGYAFDGHRTKLRATNLLVYGAMFTHKTIGPVERVNNYIDSLYQGDKEIFTCRAPSGESRTLGDRVSLLLTNVNSMMGGVDVWGAADRGCFWWPPDEAYLLLQSKQKMGDGLVEWMTISNMFNLFTLKSSKTGASRVLQGAPPFTLNFKKEYKKPIFFQVDGENFRARKLRRIVIQQRAKIWVLSSAGQKAARLREIFHKRRVEKLRNSKPFSGGAYR